MTVCRAPDFAPCDFFLFPKLKILLKGTHFQSTEDIHKKMAELLKAVSQNDFRRRFETWKTPCGVGHTSNIEEAKGSRRQ
jgi:hypothetical protein